jgi:hypothetical protein
MKKTTLWIALAVAAASFSLAGTVQAKASASAQLGSITITLFDLNPSDAIAPTITFNSGTTSGIFVGVYDYANDLYDTPYVDGVGPLTLSAATPLGAASGRVTGGGATLAGTGVEASNWIAGDGVTANNSQANTNAGGGFTLTPWTAVSFSTEALVTAATTVGYDGVSLGEYGQATVGLIVSTGVAEYHQTSLTAFASYTIVFDPATGEYVYGPQSATVGGAFSLSYANASAVAAEAFVNAYAYTEAYSNVAVPEPETYTLMLAGLGLVGFMSKQRRRI